MMPLYFFNTDDQIDHQGTRLESVAAAKCEAIKMAGRIICDEAETFWDKAEWTLTVKDESNLTLFQLCIVGTEAPVIWSPQPSRSAPAAEPS